MLVCLFVCVLRSWTGLKTMERHSSVNIQELGSLYTEHEHYKNDTMTFRRWHRLEPTLFMLCIFFS